MTENGKRKELFRMLKWSKLFVFIFLLLSYKNIAFSADKVIGLNDKHIHYVGRWDKSAINNFHSYWGGAYFDIKFKGNSLKINLSKPVNIYVKLDERKMVLFKNVSGWVKLTPDSLINSVHCLRVIAKFQDDEIQLEGISLNEGAKLLKPEKKKYWIEFIGDSITSGDKTSKGNTSAYPWLCGELLNADHTQISYCGIPLTDGYQYHYNGAPEIGMESAFLNLEQPNHQPNQKWAFSNSPDLVVINLGTNDHNLKVTKELYKQTFTQFLRNLRFVYSNATIAVLVPFNQSYTEQINQLMANEKQTEKKLMLVNTQNWLSDEDFADGTHPTDTGHLKIANELVKIIKPIL